MQQPIKTKKTDLKKGDLTLSYEAKEGNYRGSVESVEDRATMHSLKEKEK